MRDPNSLDTPDAAREIVRTRLLDAPVERVFRAWTEPEHMAAWWGPAGFTNTFEEFDPRPGGHWRFTMTSPAGADFPNESVFSEVGSSRIVLNHVSGPSYVMIATFELRGEQTEITVLQRFAEARVRDQVLKFAPTANDENLDRLEVELARME